MDENSLELEINPPYIGSAYSPEVDITETTETITVTITDAQGAHSYDVPNSAGAIADAQAATTAANNAASAANSAAGTANTAATNANTKAGLASDAASLASEKAALAVEKAELAAQAAFDANGAAETALHNASQALSAASSATSAATAAGNAASAANSAVEYADTATRDASAAADAANGAASAANSAAGAATNAIATVDAAVSAANAAAGYANEKGGIAASAASDASAAATLANQKAGLADTAATNANNKATAANNAATLANTKAGLANDAATLANTKAGLANDAATAANNAADAANALVERYAWREGTVLNADNITGSNPLESSYLYRVAGGSTGVHGGAAKIEVIKGNTLVWNQLFATKTISYTSDNYEVNSNNDGKWTVTTETTATTNSANVSNVPSSAFVAGHVYMLLDKSNNVHVKLKAYQKVSPVIFTVETSQYTNVSLEFTNLAAGSYDLYPQLFDLTSMFGAGNEPATVAEFECMFPEPYYHYDTGSPLNVNMLGIETTGFNLTNLNSTVKSGIYNPSVSKPIDGSGVWTGMSYDGYFRNSVIASFAVSGYTVSATRDTSTVYGVGIEFLVVQGITYCYGCESISNGSMRITWFDENGVYISHTASTSTYETATAPTGAAYGVLGIYPSSQNVACTCVKPIANISNPLLNGTYEPYDAHELEIPVSDYFANGMRSAGSARDALYADHYDTVIGSVDLGTLNWGYVSGNNSRFYVTFPDAKYIAGGTRVANIECAELSPASSDSVYYHEVDKIIALHLAQQSIWVYDSAYTDAATFKAAMSGVILYYELATPTTTPITPPLNLTYAVERGGTECVLVDETADAPQSAPPVMTVCYSYDADGLNDRSLSMVAAVENGKASTNYAVGSYLVHGGQLYKVTSAIASGETITPGTNVTATTVMAELIALTS